MKSCKVIAVANQKGGVGKTTTAFNIGYSLAEEGKRILLVDFDPQANLSMCCGIERPDEISVSMHEVLTTIMDGATLDKCSYIHKGNNLDFIPSNINLSATEINLRDEMGGEHTLAELLTPLRANYDYIIIDTNPYLGLLTINALAACDEVIIPVSPQLWSATGLTDLLQTIYSKSYLLIEIGGICYMTGSLTKKKGYYYVVANIYINGKRIKKWISTGIPAEKGNKRKADAKLREVLSELALQKTDITHDFYNITFHEFIVLRLESIRNTIEPNTYESYTTPVLKHIAPYFEKRKILLKNLSPIHLQEYYNYLLKEGRLNGKGGLTPSTIKRHHSNISKCLNYAMKLNLIPYSPAQRVELPKVTRFVGDFYNAEETQQLLDACKGDLLEPVIVLTAFYGLRRSEALGLKWDAVNFMNGTIQIRHTIVKMRAGGYIAKDRTKNDSSYRTLPLIPIVGEYLMRVKQQQDEHKRIQPNDYIDLGYICVKFTGELLRPDYVSQHFPILLRRNNMRVIRFHDLRHSAATNLLAAGCSMKEIQEWLGHADIGTTMNVYAHIDMKMKRNIADKLGNSFVIN